MIVIPATNKPSAQDELQESTFKKADTQNNSIITADQDNNYILEKA